MNVTARQEKSEMSSESAAEKQDFRSGCVNRASADKKVGRPIVALTQPLLAGVRTYDRERAQVMKFCKSRGPSAVRKLSG
jgi:hypothetical protein